MPEAPDVIVYCEALSRRVVGATLARVDILNPFLLRTAEPPLASVAGRKVLGVSRLGKRIVISLEGDLHLVIHLMIAGRLRWLEPGKRPPGRITLAVFEFSTGRVAFTEAGTRRRASLHVVLGDAALQALDPGGVDVGALSVDAFAERLQRENHTLKRVLTDPHLFSGIGNAYSDEILHRARLSPIAMSQKLTREEVERLHIATQAVIEAWTRQLRADAGDAFPEGVTAFRPGMAVHGRYGEPCPVCNAPVQRIVYAENECNYCARCQTGGRLLADRALSRLLHKSWPRSIDALE